ncbi:MAG: hypothetical protein HY22_02545 [[Candidatus Thermochlorobacteriaceae] bacterium GBChlB]|nr:MAG: hypothetical protein HY22_02545 [[Candidatus Thermochlorobacteriaceae] bacterium GBChlB]
MESIKVRIYGDDYPLLVENRELTEAAARQVDKLMAEYRQKAADLGAARLAILAAIHLAEKTIEAEQRLAAVTRDMERLCELSESALHVDTAM